MNVVGNNIANVSTIGFKGQRVDFNDYLYVNGGSTSGPTQIGAGVSTYAVIGDFSQGSLETTNSGTDIAIDGEGFFKVRKPNTDQMYYTRAGDFYFNADRQLQNPEGYRLQGWKVDSSRSNISFKKDSINLGENTTNESPYLGSGTPKDIVLDSWHLQPQRTTSVSMTMGLTNMDGYDRMTEASKPLTALFDQWDGTKNPPLATNSYATSSSIKVYDEAGTPHELTTYFDQVSTKSDKYQFEGLPAGYTVYEYIVTMDPSEDNRTYGGVGYDKETNTWAQDPKSFQDTQAAGMLMAGLMIFDAGGNLVNQSAYSYGATDTPATNNQCALDPTQLGSWQTTKFSSNGLPTFCANFTGQPLANSVSENDGGNPPMVEGFITDINFGIRNLGGDPNDWKLNNNMNSMADLAGTDLDGDGVYEIAYANIPKFSSVDADPESSKTISGSSVTQDATQNGYTYGVLSGTNITNDGVVYGYYDNGETIPLYQIALYDFHNKQGLRREGGNLYAATKESGEARQGVAGDNGFGVTRSYNIEGSNVDMSREFVNMITTQRGFQANSKGITTVDTMLETVIGMKR